MFVLNRSQTEALLAEPETGMGYQRVEVELVSNEIKTGYVFNAEYLQAGDAEPVPLNLEQYKSLMKAPSRHSNVIRSIRVIIKEDNANQEALKAAGKEATASETGAGDYNTRPATQGKEEKTQGQEIFKRFTAYRNDRRIRADGSLLPGTYATTEADARNVATGTDAVARYALPDPTPAIYVFTVTPQPGTLLKRGFVQPAFGHAGGGEEVIFTQGTTACTVTGPATIPAL